MRIKFSLVLLAVLTCTFTMYAQPARTIHVTNPGTLPSLLGSDKMSITDLTLTGTINSTDFQAIKEMISLKKLDLSAISVNEGKIPNNAFNKKTLDEIVLPETLQSIESHAFYGSVIKNKLILPASLKTIANNAFQAATLEVDFSQCTELQSIGNDAFQSAKINHDLDFGNNSALTVMNAPFKGLENHIILPKALKTLPAKSFYDFKGTVELPLDLETIESMAFFNSNIKGKLILPASLKTIANNAFQAATLEVDFSQCAELQSIGNDAFQSAKINHDLDFGNNSALTVMNAPFKGLENHIILPKALKTLPAKSFYDFKGTVELPLDLETIESMAFFNSNIKSKLILPASLKTIANNAFQAATLEVDFSRCTELQSIGNDAFQSAKINHDLDFGNNSALTVMNAPFKGLENHIILPKALKTLPAKSFYDFKGTVELPLDLETIESMAFFNSNIKGKLILPTSLKTIANNAFQAATLEVDFSQCTELQSIGNDAFQSAKISHDLDFGNNSALMVMNAPFKGLENHIILPKNLKAMPAKTLYEFKGTVELPSKLETIESMAFFNSNIKGKLILPASLKTIANNAFQAAALEVDFSQCAELQSIGNDAFQSAKISHDLDFGNNSAITVMNAPFKGLENHIILPKNLKAMPAKTLYEFKGTVELPSELETIESMAFFNSNIKGKLILPASLKTIANNAFQAAALEVDFSQCAELQSIGNDAFQSAKISHNLDFGNNSALTVMNAPFKGLENHIILPKNLKAMPAKTLYEFKGTVELPSKLETIESMAFFNSNIKGKLILPASLKTIANNAFQAAALEVDFSQCAELQSIGNDAFQSAKISHDLDFGNNSALTVMNAPFKGLENHIILPKALKTLPAKSFYDFKGTVELPLDLETIESMAFFNSAIREIILPSSTKKIESNAFYNCSQLEKITSMNPTPPQLGNTIFFGVNTQTCKLYVPESSVSIYSTSDQWKDFLADFVEPETPSILNRVDLFYTEDSGNTVLGQYEGVRIGEYYWMNSPYRGDHISLNNDDNDIVDWRNSYNNVVTVENINLLHERLLMFEYSPLEANKKVYFDQFLTEQPLSAKIDEFKKYYGTYVPRSFIDWMWVYGKHTDTKVRLMEGENKSDIGWDLPDAGDVRQLIAMCGNGTMHEVRQYLSYGYEQTDAPAIAKISPEPYFDWFYHNPTNFDESSDGYSQKNTNKYGFNMFPSGSMENNPAEYSPLVGEQAQYVKDQLGKEYPYQTKRGDFTGLNQQFSLALHGNVSFILHDMPEIRAGKSYKWTPIRWCRPLTAEELGYELYINQSDFSDTQQSLINLRAKLDNNAEVIIEKKKYGETPSAGFSKLAKGYLRGFYVQYILDNPNTEKTISDIVDIALDNIYVWPDRIEGRNLDIQSTNEEENTLPFGTEQTEVLVYPNPVTDILYINSDNIQKIEIFDLSGRLLLKTTDSSLNVSELKSGIYIVKVTTPFGVSGHKVSKK